MNLHSMLSDVLEAPALNPIFRFYFRLVDPADAALICTLRSDPSLKMASLSSSSPDVEAQRRWIESYKEREAEGREFYFVIVADGADQGVVRMYDFREIDGRKSFCWGSWIIKPPRPPGLVAFLGDLHLRARVQYSASSRAILMSDARTQQLRDSITAQALKRPAKTIEPLFRISEQPFFRAARGKRGQN